MMIRTTIIFLFLFTLAFARTTPLDPPNWRIVGGQDAVPGQFPYIISLRNFLGHNCGGSIFDKQWVITAAHCVAGSVTTPSKLYVVAGITKLNEEGVRYEIEKIIQHEKYDPGYLTDDIAIIKLNTSIVESDKIKIISLETDTADSTDVTLSGWGSTSYPSGDVPNDLQFLDLKTIPWQDCDDKLIMTGLRVHAEQICTLTQKGEGACYGDSGGPLVKYSEDKEATLVGLVSWGQPCANGYPDVFTRVASYSQWITDNKK